MGNKTKSWICITKLRNLARSKAQSEKAILGPPSPPHTKSWISISKLRNRARSKARSEKAILSPPGPQAIAPAPGPPPGPSPPSPQAIAPAPHGPKAIAPARPSLLTLQAIAPAPPSPPSPQAIAPAPHGPHGLYDGIQSEVKLVRKLQRFVTFPIAGSLKYFSLAVKSTSDQRASHELPDETLEDQNQSAKRPMNEKTTEWVMLITSVLLEAMSAVFDQVGYALMGMVISFLALLLFSLHLICKARKEGVKRGQPSRGLLDYYGLAAAVWQCFYSTMEYLYTLKNQQNPIKICLLPFIFALFVLLVTRRRAVSRRERVLLSRNGIIEESSLDC